MGCSPKIQNTFGLMWPLPNFGFRETCGLCRYSTFCVVVVVSGTQALTAFSVAPACRLILSHMAPKGKKGSKAMPVQATSNLKRKTASCFLDEADDLAASVSQTNKRSRAPMTGEQSASKKITDNFPGWSSEQNDGNLVHMSYRGELLWSIFLN